MVSYYLHHVDEVFFLTFFSCNISFINKSDALLKHIEHIWTWPHYLSILDLTDLDCVVPKTKNIFPCPLCATGLV